MNATLQWLWREGGLVLQWWALISLAGVAVLPLTMSWLRNLPDRGALLARALGLLLIGGLFWLLVNFGLLTNSAGSIALCWLMVLLGSVLTFTHGHQEGEGDWRAWWRRQRMAIICGELLFLILLFGWALVRAQIQELASTEKPMDLMMLSAINNSPSFPPNDAWLSGHSLSYYYFGYLLAASLAKLSGVANAVAFNLTSASWFALSGITIYGVAYNLLRWRGGPPDEEIRDGRRTLSVIPGALLAVFFALWLSNGHYPIIELPYQSGTASPEYLRFWDAKDRCEGSGTVYWWWFGAARTLVDRAPGYADDCDRAFHIEVIDEFPAFSFLLSDNHPHVLGIPFAALLMALAWHRFTNAAPPRLRDIALYGACLGAQFCTNIWDAPIYYFLLVAAEGLRRWRSKSESRWQRADGWALLRFAALLGVFMLIYASPLLLTIRTQARGLLANLDYPTRVQQLFIMFAPFVLLLITFINRIDWRRENARGTWRLAISLTLFLLFALSLFTIVIGLISGVGNLSQNLSAFFVRRSQVIYALSTVFLAVGILFFIRQLLLRRGKKLASDFTMFLVLLGMLLVLVPEFVYIHDLFGSRMNTVFKLYYQAWLLFAVAAAYGCHNAIASAGSGRFVTGGALILVVALGALYLPAGILSRIGNANPREYSLDGAHTVLSAPDQALSECLMQQLAGRSVVITEGLPARDRRAYNARYGRIATISGLPTVIAWEPHQSQWRGDSYSATVGARPEDIDNLYRLDDPQLMQEIIRRYEIEYIVWGREEQDTYGAAAEQKFADQLSVYCPQELIEGRSLAYATGYRQEN